MKITRILLTLILITLLAVNVSALEDLKPAKLNQQYTILQTCASCSFVNASISNVNGVLIADAVFTNIGSGTWAYNMTPTVIGIHDVTGVGDIGGQDTSFATRFPVTSSGLLGTLGFYFLILILSVGLIILGFSIQDPWVVVLGGFGLVLVGLFTMFYGIDGMKDTVYTWGLGIIILMSGAYFSVRAAAETMFGQ